MTRNGFGLPLLIASVLYVFGGLVLLFALIGAGAGDLNGGGLLSGLAVAGLLLGFGALIHVQALSRKDGR